MAETHMAWLVPDRVIYAQARSQNLEENLAAVNRAIEMMEQSSAATIHHLIDQSRFSSAMQEVDLNVASRDISRLLTHPKIGWVLTCYGDNMFVQYVNWVLAHENQVRSQHFESAQSAVDFLLSKDQTLSGMPDIEAFIQDFDRGHR